VTAPWADAVEAVKTAYWEQLGEQAVEWAIAPPNNPAGSLLVIDFLKDFGGRIASAANSFVKAS